MFKCGICGQHIYHLQPYTRNAAGGMFHTNRDECKRPEFITVGTRVKSNEREMSYPAGYKREE